MRVLFDFCSFTILVKKGFKVRRNIKGLIDTFNSQLRRMDSVDIRSCSQKPAEYADSLDGELETLLVQDGSSDILYCLTQIKK